jgi:hypothetical protein
MRREAAPRPSRLRQQRRWWSWWCSPSSLARAISRRCCCRPVQFAPLFSHISTHPSSSRARPNQRGLGRATRHTRGPRDCGGDVGCHPAPASTVHPFQSKLEDPAGRCLLPSLVSSLRHYRRHSHSFIHPPICTAQSPLSLLGTHFAFSAAATPNLPSRLDSTRRTSNSRVAYSLGHDVA